MEIVFKRAEEKDIPFIRETIINAEKSSKDILSYSKIFNISEQDFIPLLDDMIDEDIEGNEICISNYIIAFVDGEHAAAVSSWIEGEEGDSAMIKSSILMHYLPKESLEHAKNINSLINQTRVGRTIDSLQIESLFVKEKFRGNRLAARIFKEHAKYYKELDKLPEFAQLHVAANNKSAISAYKKMGFEQIEESFCSDEKILDYLPCQSNLLLQINTDKLLNL